MDRKEINAILSSAGLRPQHQFGQNFMVDQKVLAAIADAGEIQPEDVVLEVGPGVGNLTRQLAARASRGAVLGVDIDRNLMPAAQRYHAELKNLHWLNADVLAGKHAIEPAVIAKLRELKWEHRGGGLKLVSNLPYNAASPLVAELLVECWREMNEENRTGMPMGPLPQGHGTRTSLFFDRMAFTVQFEVGQRMTAGPGSRDYGPLGVIIQAMSGRVEIVRKIPPGAFWPAPKVHSSLVVVVPDREKTRRVRDAVALQLLLQGVFSHRRQTLGNALKHYLGERWTRELRAAVADAGFDLMLRPEMFSVEQFLKLDGVLAGVKAG